MLGLSTRTKDFKLIKEKSNMSSLEKQIEEVLIFSCTGCDKNEKGEWILPSSCFPTVTKDLGLVFSERELSLYRTQLEGTHGDTIPLSDLQTFLLSLMSGYNPEVLKSALSRLDADGDGLIPIEELEYTLDLGMGISDEDRNRILKLASPDSEGNVDVNNFLNNGA